MSAPARQPRDEAPKPHRRTRARRRREYRIVEVPPLQQDPRAAAAVLAWLAARLG